MVCKRIFSLSVILLLVCEAASEIVCDYALKLDGTAVEEDGSVTHENMNYPPGTFWKNNDGYFGCPCQIQPCIRLCATELTQKMKDYTVPEVTFQVEIVSENDEKKTVALNEHYVVWKESLCPVAYLIDPEDEKYSFSSNGSLKMLHNDGELETVLLFSQYCILKDNKGEPALIECLPADEEGKYEEKNEQSTSMKSRVFFILYSVFMAISIVFIILTILAYILTPEMKNLHGKCIVLQCGTLAVAYVAFIVLHQTGSDNHVIICKITAYTAYAFMMSSFCWINCMCFDLFWITKYDISSAFKRLMCYVAYSTLFPAVQLTVVLILEFSLDEASSIWPGIGHEKCWFSSNIAYFYSQGNKDRKSEAIFFHAPILLMLIASVIFCVTAYVQDKRSNRFEVQRNDDASGSPKADYMHSALLYVKLFVLMGGTWVMELTSWLVGGPQEYWIFTDLVNCSRGLLIFIVCVLCNARVRGSLMRRILRKNYESAGGVNQVQSPGNFTAAIEFIDLNNRS